MKQNIIQWYRNCRYTKYGNDLTDFLRYLYSRDPFRRKLKIKNKGSIRFARKDVEGANNTMVVGKHTLLNRVTLKIRGSNNTISIGENCKIGKGCQLYLFGNNLELRIGDGCTFSHDDELFVQENDAKIIIGNDCMFSHHINVRTSDSHPIYDLDGERINFKKDVHIGNHVWVTPHCIIQKGVTIEDGSIVATNSIVTKDVPSHTIVAGMPAKVVKEGVCWDAFFHVKR